MEPGIILQLLRLNALSLLPGDSVGFKSGQKFTDDILNCKKGVTYITYGIGSTKAIIGDSLSNLVEKTTTIQIDVEDVTLNNLKVYGF